MHTIISIVGKSGSGKTTLIEGLIAELKKRGYKVAIVKHSHHAADLDTEAKDTWRFTQAGSELSVLSHWIIWQSTSVWIIISTHRKYLTSFSGTMILF